MRFWDSKPEKPLSVMGRNADPIRANPAGLCGRALPEGSLVYPVGEMQPMGHWCFLPWQSCVFLKSHLKLIVLCSQHWVLCSGVTDQGRRGASHCPVRNPCPPLLPAQLRPSLFCFRFLRSFWVTSLQCRGSSSRKDGRLEELASLGELPAWAELSPCSPSQHHEPPNQGRGSVGSRGVLSRVGTPQGGVCAPHGSCSLCWCSLGWPHIPTSSTGSAGCELSLLPEGAGALGWEQAQLCPSSHAQAAPTLLCQ